MEQARVFAAIQFSSEEKQAVARAADALRPQIAAGRLSRPELLHVTLHFFGDTPRSRFDAIFRAMERAAAAHEPFAMRTSLPGMFGGAGGVLWLGVGDGADALRALQASLERELGVEGFPVESRPFRAHITLGREVRLQPGVWLGDIPISALKLAVNAVTLMESTRASGRLAYVPVFAAELGRGRQMR